MRILVAQMTRMGDTLQTTPLIRALKRRHPDAHITVMVRRMGRAIAEHNPDIDDIILYEEDEMFLDLRSDDSDRLLKAYEKADAYVQRLKEGRFDVAYNCTHSITSAGLLKMAEVPEVVGAHLSGEWQFVLRGRAVNFFFTSVHHRKLNDLNICDQFRLFLEDAPTCDGLVFDVEEEDRQFVTSLLSEHGVETDDFVACFQLGASDTMKRWPEEYFAAVGKALVEQRNAHVFLLGVPDEAPLGESFERHAPGIAVPLYGKTTVPQLAALLERTNALVTNDTGTMHIAAAVGCPIVLVSTGYVHFRETGPYGAGYCAVERRRETYGRSDVMRQAPEEDRYIVQPAHVLKGIEVVLGGDSEKAALSNDDSSDLDAVDFYCSRFAPDGCLQWYPLLRRPFMEADYLRIAYRAMWIADFGQRQPEQTETEGLARLLGCYTDPRAEDVSDWRGRAVASMTQLADLAQQGVAATEQLLGQLRNRGSMSEARDRVHELVRLDEDIRLFGEVHGACRPLVVIARFERDNLEGADPLPLAETTLQIYRDLHSRADLVRQKLELVARVWKSLHS